MKERGDIEAKLNERIERAEAALLKAREDKVEALDKFDKDLKEASDKAKAELDAPNRVAVEPEPEPEPEAEPEEEK